MQVLQMGRVIILAVILSTAIVTGAGGCFADEQEIKAQWRAYQVRFRFVGQSSAYTCDGIEYTLKRLLRLMGARDDMRVQASCAFSRRPDQFHRVKMAFSMPVPADESDLSAEFIPAQWQKVRVAGLSSRYLDAGDCELLEQFERQVLPKLEVYNPGKRVRCIPYRREFNNIRLNLMAIVPLEQPELEQKD